MTCSAAWASGAGGSSGAELAGLSGGCQSKAESAPAAIGAVNRRREPDKT